MIERFDPRRASQVEAQYASQLHGAGQRGREETAPAYDFAPEEVTDDQEYSDYAIAERLHAVEVMTEDAGLGEAAAAEPEPEVADERRPAGRRGASHWVAWVAGLAAVGLVVGGLIVLMLKFLNGPVEAKPNAKTLDQLRASVEPTPVTQVLSGQAVEFSYPGVFDQVRKMQDAVTDSYYLASKRESSRTIAVAVVALPSGRAQDDSGYKYRLLHPELYSETRETIKGEQVIIMTKKDNTEATMFWPHKDKCLNIAITSTAPRDKVMEFMNIIKPTVRWRQ